MPKKTTQSFSRAETSRFRQAYSDGDRHAMKLAVQNGANPNARISKGAISYLDEAEANNRSSGIAALLECGVIADNERVRELADIEDTDGFYPMQQAAADGFHVALTRLLDAGIDIDIWNGWDYGTPLLMAVQCGREDTVCFLLNRGAAVDARNVHGITPLYEACTRGGIGIVRALLLKGADIDARIPYDVQVAEEGWSVFEMVNAWCDDEMKSLINYHKAMLLKKALGTTLAGPVRAPPRRVPL